MTKNIFRIVLKNKVIFTETLIELNEIEEAFKIDSTIFQAHQTLSTSTFREIAKQGGLLAVKSSDQIIGVSAILINPIKDGPTFSPEAALCFGTAILPEFRRKGYGTALAKTQEMIAKHHEKTKLLLSVRPENAPSILMRLKLGFKIIRYDPYYFGDENIKNGRLILFKSFTERNNRNESLSKDNNFVKVTFIIGEKIDVSAREKLLSLQSEGLTIFDYYIDESGKQAIYYLATNK